MVHLGTLCLCNASSEATQLSQVGGNDGAWRMHPCVVFGFAVIVHLVQADEVSVDNRRLDILSLWDSQTTWAAEHAKKATADHARVLKDVTDRITQNTCKNTEKLKRRDERRIWK